MTLVDQFQRRISYLRLSVTDRCDLRCAYCMPERQTFLRLPETSALAFGIHTYSDPLATIAGDAESLGALHRLLGSYSDERLAYGGMLGTQPAIMRWPARASALLETSGRRKTDRNAPASMGH